MRRLRYSKEAQADLVSIVLYFSEATGSGMPGRRVADRIRAKCRKFAALPGMMGRPRPELGAELRSFVVGSYVVFIRYDERDRFDVVAVIEGHRDIDAYFQSFE